MGNMFSKRIQKKEQQEFGMEGGEGGVEKGQERRKEGRKWKRKGGEQREEIKNFCKTGIPQKNLRRLTKPKCARKRDLTFKDC